MAAGSYVAPGWRARWEGLAGWVAEVAGRVVGTAIRALRRSRPLVRMAPGVSGAALASVGIGEVVSHVFGHGLAPWVACCVAAGFLLRIGAEINQVPRQPPEPEG